MRFITALAVLGSLGTAQAIDYFLVFRDASPSIINDQRFRLNTSLIATPGVTEAPYNPDDHFSRLVVRSREGGDTQTGGITELLVIPTHPHPPPVPGFYALQPFGTADEGATKRYRLIETWRPEEEAGLLYQKWIVDASVPGRVRLDYDVGSRTGTWEVTEETTQVGVKRWLPVFVVSSTGGDGAYPGVSVELVEAKGLVNSLAPGGVEE